MLLGYWVANIMDANWMRTAGKMRGRITIQAATATQDAAGQPVVTWATFQADVPCKVESVAGGEAIRGRQVVATATTLFTCRYIAGVTTKHRVTYAGRTFGILRAADPFGDRRELRIEAAEPV